MKVRDLIKLLEKDGWVLDRTKKHKVYEHPTKVTLNGRPLTVPNHLNEELAAGTLNGILKNAGLK